MIFPPFSSQPETGQQKGQKEIHFFTVEGNNSSRETIEAFGDEWKRFDSFSMNDIDTIARKHYFDIVPPGAMAGKHLLDVGCGTGRWTRYAAKFAATVDAVDPSEAIESAAVLLKDCDNVRIARASTDTLPFADETFDMVFSLGVLHHIPDTSLALRQCTSKLKKNGLFLVYLYYKLDNKGPLFRLLFNISALFRMAISRFPKRAKNITCDVIAVGIYMPLILAGRGLKAIGMHRVAESIPLSFYIDKNFHVIRNDARDRFGTPLEQRFTKKEIEHMMRNAGLRDIVFSNETPYWHATGRKA